MAKLIISGNYTYVKALERHLHKEHPTTKHGTRVENLKDHIKRKRLYEDEKIEHKLKKILKGGF